jgi:hypothetical protein
MKMLMLPDGEVTVLRLQRQKRRTSSLMESRVENGQLAQKNIKRPTIRNDVMERNSQSMVFLAQLKKLRPPQGPTCEVEWNARILRKETCEPIWLCLQIAIGQRKAHLRVDDLRRLSILHLKGGAQRFMAMSDLMKRTDQRAAIECAFKLDGNWDVVCRRSAKLLEKPEPALSEREGYRPCLPEWRRSHFYALRLRNLHALGNPAERARFKERL